MFNFAYLFLINEKELSRRITCEPWSCDRDDVCVGTPLPKRPRYAKDIIDNFLIQLDGAPPQWSAKVRNHLYEHISRKDGLVESQTTTFYLSNSHPERKSELIL
ncbi:hypothetical protein TNCV_3661811 [Trichonephila clavipes]|nr:hypothetical protein TNCV_3661811 [Trichonephila clavipes]